MGISIITYLICTSCLVSFIDSYLGTSNSKNPPEDVITLITQKSSSLSPAVEIDISASVEPHITSSGVDPVGIILFAGVVFINFIYLHPAVILAAAPFLSDQAIFSSTYKDISSSWLYYTDYAKYKEKNVMTWRLNSPIILPTQKIPKLSTPLEALACMKPKLNCESEACEVDSYMIKYVETLSKLDGYADRENRRAFDKLMRLRDEFLALERYKNSYLFWFLNQK